MCYIPAILLYAMYNLFINWFNSNDMIVNPDKFQAIIINRHKKGDQMYSLNINNTQIETSSEVNLLGIEIDNNLSFNNHIHNLTKTAAGQLNVEIVNISIKMQGNH